MMRLFNETLAEYETKQIQEAFIQWAKTSSVMPTPADIIKIIEDGEVYNRAEYKVDEPDYHWRAQRKEYQKETKVYWMGQNYPDMTEQTKQDIRVHIGRLALEDKTKAMNYCLYLSNWCKFPKDFHKEVFQ